MHGRTHVSASPPSSASAATIPSYPGLFHEGGAHRRNQISSPSHLHSHSRSPGTRVRRHDPTDEQALSFEQPVAMSPLALVLQAHWRQLQQEMLNPSSWREHSDAHAVEMEEDVLRILGSISAQPEMAVKDAVHTVPYLIALGQMPLPSLRTQAVALSALRGVLSSLALVFGSKAAERFVKDIFLGEHQALQAVALAALVAMEEPHNETEMRHSESTKVGIRGRTSTARGSPSGASLVRTSHRSLLARDNRAAKEGSRLIQGSQVPLKDLGEAASQHPSIAFPVDKNVHDLLDKKAALRTRVVHVALQLLREAAVLCGPIADALLSSGSLFKRCMDSLLRLPPPPRIPNLAGGLSSSHPDSSSESLYVACLHRCEDIVSFLMTLLITESTRHNEASLVLCSFGAPRAVWTLAQHLVHTGVSQSGATRVEANALVEVTSTLLWDALKILRRLTCGCPPAIKLFLSETTGVPAFLVQALTTPVAEIREAGALWAAALLETQPEESAELASSLLDVPSIPTKTMMLCSSTPLPAFVLSLVEMLRWRGEQMDVFRVSAILCWRWLLLSNPSRVAALLLCDSSVLATLIELILRGAMLSPSPSSHTLPLRLTALEALHVFSLSYTLGTVETRTQIESQVLRGPLSRETLLRLRIDGRAILEQTHPGYWSCFPTMEVELMEGATELSEEMQHAGATVRTHVIDETNRKSSGLEGQRRRHTMCISTSVAWRQVVLESLWDLTDVASHTDTSPAYPLAGGRRQGASRDQRPEGLPTAPPSLGLGMFTKNVVEASPIRVLDPLSPSHAWARGADPEGSEMTTGTKRDGSTASRLDTGALDTLIHSPRTIREAILLPTQQSTTIFRFHVVQQAHGLGGSFVQDSMRVVLQLAQHYTQTSASSSISSKNLRCTIPDAGKRQRPVVPPLGKPRRSPSRPRSTSPGPRTSACMTPPSAVFGTAPRFVDSSARIEKECNPFAPVAKLADEWQAQLPRRQWRVKELQRDDVLLFLVDYSHLMTDLPDAVAAVEDHLQFLRRQLQLCPTREIRRRCVLNDLYMNVYPKIHVFLRYMDQQARGSRSVLQLLSTFSGGTIHSGNVVDVYDAVGRCSGHSTTD